MAKQKIPSGYQGTYGIASDGTPVLIMATRNSSIDTSQPARTTQDKCDYYSRRANDPKLTPKQRSWANLRLRQLCGGGSSKGQSAKTGTCKSALPATAQQNNARNAGIGYGAAKVGARVPVAPENRQSFRDGVKVGRTLGKKF